MTQQDLDGLACVDSETDVHGTQWLICATQPDAYRPFVILKVGKQGGRREFSRWAGSLSHARAKVADLLILARAIENVPLNRRASPTKAMPR